ncbi:hypothetical protein MMC07_007393 [Pseudocyphellaria aurata]|nr:hypothetical protein [Pseudocyphellaria aurata]
MTTMFGALNRFISRLDSDSPSQSSRENRAFGFQVLRNKNLEIAIEPWYDFIVGINGRQLDDSDPDLFATEVRNCAGSSVALTLWNAKGQRSRSLQISVPTPSPTLGITLQWTPLSSTEAVWHILDVIPDSPADKAGLLPYGDYVVGTPEGTVHGESGLGELVEDYLSRALGLYVYNHEYGVTRLVTITPSRSWGGSGALGCVLGFGALHRLPPPLTEPPAAPGETLFETARFSNEGGRPASTQPQASPLGNSLPQGPSTQQSSNFLIPATMTSPPPPPPVSNLSSGPPRSARKGRHAASSQGFDDYFKEGEQKSKEEDFAPSAREAPPPPPPKSGIAPPPQAKTPDPSVESESEVP